jgi:tetratricopeptide (TPR) repeat protein
VTELVPFVMAALLAIELLGVPSGGSTPLEGEMRRIDALIASHEFSAALAAIDALRADAAADPLLERQAARAYAGLGRLSDEAAAWESFLQRSPIPGDGCLRLIEVYELLDQPAQVLPVAERCLAVDTDHAAVLGRLAHAQEALGDLTGAEASLERAVRADPRDPTLRVRLAERLRARGRPDEAQAHVAAALEWSPGWARARAERNAGSPGERDAP